MHKHKKTHMHVQTESCLYTVYKTERQAHVTGHNCNMLPFSVQNTNNVNWSRFKCQNGCKTISYVWSHHFMKRGCMVHPSVLGRYHHNSLQGVRVPVFPLVTICCHKKAKNHKRSIIRFQFPQICVCCRVLLLYLQSLIL